MTDTQRTKEERDLSEYLGKDREELWSLLGERDAEIEALRTANGNLSATCNSLLRATNEPRVTTVPEGFNAITDECLAKHLANAESVTLRSALIELQMRRAAQPPSDEFTLLRQLVALDVPTTGSDRIDAYFHEAKRYAAEGLQQMGSSETKGVSDAG